MRKKVVLSGVQPTGELHIGNYIGALAQWVEFQDQYENLFCIVDLHAITVPESIDPKSLFKKTRETAAVYLACGIDPKKSLVFIQSHVKQHAELCWILNCVTPVGWLEKMTQYKSKSQKAKSIGTGLLDYPVLQAADILVYQAEVIPVGEDQKQHVELTRDIAIRFNNLFGKTFTIPEPLIRESGARIMGFDDPGVKMSKSIGAIKAGHAIGILDNEAKIKKTVMSAVTDAGSEFRFDKASAGILNLLTLYQVLTGKSKADIEQEFLGKGYGMLKKSVLGAVMETLRPIQEKFNRYSGDKDYLEGILKDSAEKAAALAEKTIIEVKKHTGLG